jgi:hypothetical protein
MAVLARLLRLVTEHFRPIAFAVVEHPEHRKAIFEMATQGHAGTRKAESIVDNGVQNTCHQPAVEVAFSGLNFSRLQGNAPTGQQTAVVRQQLYDQVFALHHRRAHQ